MKVMFLGPTEYQNIREWWRAKDMAPPEADMIPTTTFVAYLEGVPYLSVSLFMTNTAVAWVDNFIGNPNVDKKKRRALVPELLQYISNYAKAFGKKRLFCMSLKGATSRRYQQLGFMKTAKVETFIKEL